MEPAVVCVSSLLKVSRCRPGGGGAFERLVGEPGRNVETGAVHHDESRILADDLFLPVPGPARVFLDERRGKIVQQVAEIVGIRASVLQSDQVIDPFRMRDASASVTAPGRARSIRLLFDPAGAC